MKKTYSLTKKIFISMLLGALFGILVQSLKSEFIRDTIILNGFVKVLSSIFLSSIKMMVVPLVFVSLTCGAASIESIKKLGRVGGKTFFFYITTTCIAITIGILLSIVIKPGTGLDMSHLLVNEPVISQNKSFIDIIIEIVPTNPFESFVKGDMLQVIFFSILFGLSISMVGKKSSLVKNFFDSLNEVIMKLVQLIMNFAPFGVFALMANTFATIGFNAMIPLIKYMIVILLSLLIHSLFIYGGLFKAFTRLSIKPFLKKFIKPASIVFSTASSNSALPVTLEAMDEMGVDNSISSFTIPLGSTINMDGTAIMQGVAAIFISQAYNMNLSITNILTIILTATLASIGTAGVPGVGMVMLSMVLQSVGLPIEGIGLILGIDRILDMCRSTVNTMGDCICTIIISKSENSFDENKYYSNSDNLEDLNNLYENADNSI
ncbi:MAG: dicarboxylate/amino acid:cation symporter [Clostridium sp.]|uniref:dicarboxylate/amino acid:cation symporter n=2 Tax=Clostridiaceae TaxID=31979 RepID=UPI0023304E54|nr:MULTISPECIES: dicarboxylate/amino acid:cation symporter [Clostridium]MDB1931760.1 dicarboxylate/amino acid:cation symporter [Clostridium tertium]MDB1935383.1 dicarboxylate/amino acid:cation symporter [Clostridium tertium]MDU2460142.1 dicarboxylate/amino acid:cation symporter [Clostridium sp.]MDU3407948.1 dicarboxylate/amino acid:cation symporter [Clostridium sp.]MDU6365273.1 dicarboxylate/amino acid:cation symporter [Clostridium sp.]